MSCFCLTAAEGERRNKRKNQSLKGHFFKNAGNCARMRKKKQKKRQHRRWQQLRPKLHFSAPIQNLNFLSSWNRIKQQQQQKWKEKQQEEDRTAAAAGDLTLGLTRNRFGKWMHKQMEWKCGIEWIRCFISFLNTIRVSLSTARL